MTREIKFRGFNTKNGKWLYGCYILNRGEHFIAPPGIVEDPFATAEDFKVIPETIGQFTGLYDKDGNEIYEGDIVKFHFLKSSSVSSEMFPTVKSFGYITMNKYNQWVISSDGMEVHIENAIKYGEVVGNIHDNPELLKEEQ